MFDVNPVLALPELARLLDVFIVSSSENLLSWLRYMSYAFGEMFFLSLMTRLRDSFLATGRVGYERMEGKITHMHAYTHTNTHTHTHTQKDLHGTGVQKSH